VTDVKRAGALLVRLIGTRLLPQGLDGGVGHARRGGAQVSYRLSGNLLGTHPYPHHLENASVVLSNPQ
jgi:hypothetical protein